MPGKETVGAFPGCLVRMKRPGRPTSIFRAGSLTAHQKKRMKFRINQSIITAPKGATGIGSLPDVAVAAALGVEAPGAGLIKIICFYNPAYPGASVAARVQVAENLHKMLGDNTPPIVFVAQPPLNGAPYTLELSTVETGAGSPDIRFKAKGNIDYTLLSEGNERWLFLGIDDRHVSEADFQALVHRYFSVAEDILRSENMDFRHVVRQWNYIENITSTIRDDSDEFQYYQIFNDIRALFYEKSGMRGDYPAATGIGCDAGGFVLELLAAADVHHRRTIPIRSPVQKNAYDYSSGVLVGQAFHPVAKQAPLFERAKMMLSDDEALVFVSGTAAISGEKSADNRDPYEQTEATIRNIFELLTAENLADNGVEKSLTNLQPTGIRAYVKHPAHAEEVAACCQIHFPDTPVLLLRADVCRPELLVEMEAAFLGLCATGQTSGAGFTVADNFYTL